MKPWDIPPFPFPPSAPAPFLVPCASPSFPSFPDDDDDHDHDDDEEEYHDDDDFSGDFWPWG